MPDRKQQHIEQYLAQEVPAEPELHGRRQIVEKKLARIDEVANRHVAEQHLLRERQMEVVVVADRKGREPEEKRYDENRTGGHDTGPSPPPDSVSRNYSDSMCDVAAAASPSRVRLSGPNLMLYR